MPKGGADPGVVDGVASHPFHFLIYDTMGIGVSLLATHSLWFSMVVVANG